jgi:hypothetical protein
VEIISVSDLVVKTRRKAVQCDFKIVTKIVANPFESFCRNILVLNAGQNVQMKTFRAVATRVGDCAI